MKDFIILKEKHWQVFEVSQVQKFPEYVTVIRSLSDQRYCSLEGKLYTAEPPEVAAKEVEHLPPFHSLGARTLGSSTRTFFASV